MTVQTPQPVTAQCRHIPALDMGAQRITARLAAGRSSFCFGGGLLVTTCTNTRDQVTKLLRHLRGVELTCRSGTKMPWPRWKARKAPRPGGHTHTRLIVRNRHHIEVQEEFQSLTPAQQRELASLLASLQQLAFLGRVSLTLYCVWGPSVAKVFTTDAALRPSRPKAEHPNSNVSPQHLSTLIIFMLQGRRLQLPSASFLVCKSSSRNHALVELSPTPLPTPLHDARVHQSSAFRLHPGQPSRRGPRWREGQESGESGTRGARLAPSQHGIGRIFSSTCCRRPSRAEQTATSQLR